MKTREIKITQPARAITEVMSTDDRRIEFSQAMRSMAELLDETKGYAERFNLKLHRPLLDHKKKVISLKITSIESEENVVPTTGYWALKANLRKVNYGILRYAKRFGYRVLILS